MREGPRHAIHARTGSLQCAAAAAPLPTYVLRGRAWNLRPAPRSPTVTSWRTGGSGPIPKVVCFENVPFSLLRPMFCHRETGGLSRIQGRVSARAGLRGPPASVRHGPLAFDGGLPQIARSDRKTRSTRAICPASIGRLVYERPEGLASCAPLSRPRRPPWGRALCEILALACRSDPRRGKECCAGHAQRR